MINTDEFDLELYKNKFGRNSQKRHWLRREKRFIKPLFYGTVVLAIIAVSIVGYWFYNYNLELNRNNAIYEKALTIVRDTAEPLPAPDPTPMPTPVPDTDEAGEVKSPEQEPEKPKELLEKIKKLREAFANDDIVGYITIADTVISYPVVQSGDNEFYLRRDIHGEKNTAGTLFMDFECDPYEFSRNTVIYGHNMRDGSMFHDLRYYSEFDYWQAHPIISLITPYEETEWEIFAAYTTSTDFYYIQVLFSDDAEFNALLSEMKQKSFYDTGVDIGVEDQILTLSTCLTNVSDSRVVINAKRIKG